MATLPEYPITPVNKLGRLSKRGCYDYLTIHQLINGCPLLHASFTTPSSPFPVVLPMIGCTGNYANPSAVPEMTPQDIYLHGHVASRMFRQAAAGKPSGEETETEVEEEQEEQGMPITISASFLDGLVLSLTPFHNSCNYRSAVVFGYAKLVRDEDEAMYAMKLITENMLPGRWDDSRVPPTRAELKSTGVMRVKIVSASAKIRTGGPSEDRADLKNEELVKKTWTGVVPYFPTWKTPCPGTQNKCEKVPEYIEGWREDENQRAEMYAFEAVGEAEKK